MRYRKIEKKHTWGSRFVASRAPCCCCWSSVFVAPRCCCRSLPQLVVMAVVVVVVCRWWGFVAVADGGGDFKLLLLLVVAWCCCWSQNILKLRQAGAQAGSGQRLWLSRILGRAKSRLRPKFWPGLARLFLAWLGPAFGLRPEPAHHYPQLLMLLGVVYIEYESVWDTQSTFCE